MDKIDKALKKLSEKERIVVSKILNKLIKEDFSGLNLRKLKGYDDIFRVRKSGLRIIFKQSSKDTKLLSIDRRSIERYYENS
jgi:mRNA-degrading endonuclease RelE of RelBE toxin-antitoxin system